MRASAAFRVCIRHHGLWRTAVAVLLIVTLAAQAAWLLERLPSAGLPGTLLWAVMDVTLLVAAAGALRIAPVELHWDTRCWRIAAVAGPDAQPGVPGRLAIALDLGHWMLLRFEPDAPTATRGARWLPVQRRGLEAQWHALRCAVYCARPAVGPDGGAAMGAGPASQE
jgi:hypothetical protein